MLSNRFPFFLFLGLEIQLRITRDLFDLLDRNYLIH